MATVVYFVDEKAGNQLVILKFTKRIVNTNKNLK